MVKAFTRGKPSPQKKQAVRRAPIASILFSRTTGGLGIGSLYTDPTRAGEADDENRRSRSLA
jgi:hypothetical protein